MADRLHRDRSLPDVLSVRVSDPTVQRALDALAGALRAVLQVLQPIAQPQPFRPLPLNGDWARLSATITSPSYVRNRTCVELAGAVKTAAGGSAVIAVLPADCRPQLSRTFTVGIYNAGRTTGTVDVLSDGRVSLVSPAVAANVEVYLDGVRFDTRV